MEQASKPKRKRSATTTNSATTSSTRRRIQKVKFSDNTEVIPEQQQQVVPAVKSTVVKSTLVKSTHPRKKKTPLLSPSPLEEKGISQDNLKDLLHVLEQPAMVSSTPAPSRDKPSAQEWNPHSLREIVKTLSEVTTTVESDQPNESCIAPGIPSGIPSEIPSGTFSEITPSTDVRVPMSAPLGSPGLPLSPGRPPGLPLVTPGLSVSSHSNLLAIQVNAVKKIYHCLTPIELAAFGDEFLTIFNQALKYIMSNDSCFFDPKPWNPYLSVQKQEPPRNEQPLGETRDGWKSHYHSHSHPPLRDDFQEARDFEPRRQPPSRHDFPRRRMTERPPDRYCFAYLEDYMLGTHKCQKTPCERGYLHPQDEEELAYAHALYQDFKNKNGGPMYD